ncbi:hypothetical protein MAR_022274 [Mya arenaria]|uniref:Deltamethrin resistance protein prag01 domain-containing protein n=1 Tax=Mya arenaria TaxID=6604 RepID=A0ABY7DLS3_MYAAR|nr:uncharacterized protein LOC128226668 [Mya arenaria]WAQ97901.1 hypothetical protein MAR_022274 [Mya arenaria]
MTILRTIIRPSRSLLQQHIRYGSSATYQNTQLQEQLDQNYKQEFPMEFMTVKEKVEVNRGSMNWMAKPLGPWAEVYAKKQANYNMHMVISALLLGATVFYTWKSGLLVAADYSIPLNVDELYDPRRDMRQGHKFQWFIEAVEDGTEEDATNEE